MMHRSPFFEARARALSGQIKVRWHEWFGIAPAPIPDGIALAGKIEGMMLGLAIGDALGNTSESMNPSARRSRYGWIEGYLPNRYAGGLRIGLPSDDTQLAFRTLDHLVEQGRLHPQLLGNRLAHGRVFGMGQATREWRDSFTQGAEWHSSGTPSAGNGALMRIAPVLIPHLSAPNCDLWADALIAAHLTHDDELSNISCVAMVDALWRAIGMRGAVGQRWWLDRWLEICDMIGTGARYRPRNGHPEGFEGTISELLRQHVSDALERAIPVDAAGEIWHSGAYLLETVPTVLYILERFGNDPREAILQAVNHSRDNDTVAAIVGAGVGALHGVEALPVEWIESLAGRMAEGDDHRIFFLLEMAGRKFGYGSTGAVTDRARRFQERLRSLPVAPDIPQGLLKGELWIKVTGFLQQNWAVVWPSVGGRGARIWFVDDGPCVFDFIDCETPSAARKALRANGFDGFDREMRNWVESPIPALVTSGDSPPVAWSARRIYSTGEYWVQPDST